MDDVSFLYRNSSAPLPRVHFVKATKPDKVSHEGLNLVRLGPEAPHKETEGMPRTAQTSRHAPSNGQRELFREEDVKCNWERVVRVGAGLQNLGNTCFMNSVLQCLTYTPPLAQLMLDGWPGASGQDFDVVRALREHVGRVLARPGTVIAPVQHARNLRLISRSFRFGRQEDAHEYLVAMLDKLHERLIAPFKARLPVSVQETSMIFRIFAGRICSQVKCTECGYTSRTVDPFLDVSLEIAHASTLEKALQRFTATEYLEGDNKYICPKQATKVRAAKRISIDKAPNVLVIQLKRFGFSLYGQKIGKTVEYDTSLDMAPFMSDRRSGPVLYELYAVLVHFGHSVHSGHYLCFIRGPNKTWYCMDDADIRQVSEQVVLAQKAYILFYIRQDGGQQPAAVPELPRGAAPSMPSSEAELPGPSRDSQPEQSMQSPGRASKRKADGEEALPPAKRVELPESAEAVGGAELDSQPGAEGPLQGAFAGVDPEALRARLSSQIGAASSPQRGSSSMSGSLQAGGVPVSMRLPPARRPQPLVPAGSPSKKAFIGRSARKLDQHIHLHKLHSQSLGGTPVPGSPGMRGSSPLMVLGSPAASIRTTETVRATEVPLPDSSADQPPARRSPRIQQRTAMSPSPLRPVAANLAQPELLAHDKRANNERANSEPAESERVDVALNSGGTKPRAARSLQMVDGTERATTAPDAAVAPSDAPEKPAPRKRRKTSAIFDSERDPEGAAVTSSGTANDALPIPEREAESHQAAEAASDERSDPTGKRARQQSLPNGHAASDDGPVDAEVAAPLVVSPASRFAKKRKALDGSLLPAPSENGPKASRRTSDAATVKEVLGLTAQEAGGPSGEPVWQDADEDAKSAADDFLRSLEPGPKPLDEYDEEYDRGKTKKVRGLRGADAWTEGPGNVFQSEWNSRRRGGTAKTFKRRPRTK